MGRVRRAARVFSRAALVAGVGVALIGAIALLRPSVDARPSSLRAFQTAATATGTTVCGNVSVLSWSASHGPYLLCSSGVTIPSGKTLTISGAQGTVHVIAQGSGGITVLGTLATSQTSSSAKVVFSSATASPGAWAGIATSGTSGVISLSYSTISDAVMAVNSQCFSSSCSVSLAHVDIAHTSSVAVDTTSTLTMTGGSISYPGTRDPSDGSSPPASGILAGGSVQLKSVSISNAPSSAVVLAAVATSPTASVTGLNIVNAGTAGAPAINVGGFMGQGAYAQLTLQNNVIKTSGKGGSGYPAISIQHMNVQLGTAISGNTGEGNYLDAISCTICSSNIDFTWITPSNSSSVHPLGYLFVDEFAADSATLTVPANAVVKTLNGGIHAIVNTSGTGAVFTSLTDNSVGIHACPSVLVATCTPKPGDWSGIDDTENAHLGRPFAVINGATFRYAAIAVDVEFAGGGSSPAGSDATLTNVNIAHGYGGVAGVNASVAIAGGTITDMTTNPNPTTQSSPPPPQFWGPAGYGVMVRGTLSIKGTTESAIDAAGISARGSNVTISGNTVAQAARNLPAIGPDRGAIEVFGDATTMTPSTSVTSNTVTAAGSSSSPAFAIQLSYVNGDLGSMLAGNRGAQNWSDSVWIPFSIDTHPLTWVSAVNSTSLHPLGYAGAVEVRGAVTVTVPANAVVKGMIALKGASLDATAGGASFDIFNDNTVGAPTCFGQYTTCGEMKNNNFIIDAQANGSTPASVAIDNATMRLGGIDTAGDSLSVHDVQVNEASPAITASAAPSISVVASHFTNGGTPIAVQDSSIQLPQDFAGNTGAGNSADEVLLDNDIDTTNFTWAAAYNSTTDHPLYYAVAGNFTVDDATMTMPQRSTFTDGSGGSLIFRGGQLDAQAGGVTFDGVSCASACGFGGIQLQSSTVSTKPAANAVLDGVTITHATAAIQTSGAASASMTCSLLTKNLQGVVSGGNGITISQSTLPGQLNGPDVAASVVTYAQNDWWGQPGAPRAGQTSGPVVTQPALLGPPACAPTSAPASAASATLSMTQGGATAAQGYDAAIVERRLE